MVRFALVDAESNSYVPGYEDLKDGVVLDRSILPSELTIEAFTEPSEIPAVVFYLDGGSAVARSEKIPPYALAGDADSSGDYLPSGDLEPSDNVRSIKAVPIWIMGKEGIPLEISFTVIQS